MIKILEESRNNLLAVRVTGEIEAKDYDILKPILGKTIDEHEKAYAYIEILDLESVTPKAVMEDLKSLPTYNKFEKVAIVGDAKWKKIITDTVGKLLKPSTKYFNFDEKADAMEWVKN